MSRPLNGNGEPVKMIEKRKLHYIENNRMPIITNILLKNNRKARQIINTNVETLKSIQG